MASSGRPQPTASPSSWWSRPCRVGWNVLRFFWMMIVLAMIPSAIVAMVFLSQKTSLQSLYLWPVLDWMQNHLFVIGFSILVLVGVTGLTWFGSRHVETMPREMTQATIHTERDRKVMLRILGKEYRRQLSQSLQGPAKMELCLQERTDVTSSPTPVDSWRMGAPEEHSFRLHASIFDAYDEASNGLLILGAPGAGKSTLLHPLVEIPVTAILTVSTMTANLTA
jgi:hypothetical protein